MIIYFLLQQQLQIVHMIIFFSKVLGFLFVCIAS
jgi:hypothetical protein